MELVVHANKIGETLTTEQVRTLQELGALEWSPRDIAIYMEYDVAQFTTEYNDPDSNVSLAITRGRLMALAEISKATLAAAKAGDIPSIEQLEKARREKSFTASKLAIFGAFDDKKAFERVYEYIARGRSNELSNNEKLFLDLLTVVNSLDRQFGKRATIKFLTQQFGYTYERAVDYYNQADQLFYSTRTTTKEALRNKYADMLDDLAHAARNAATTPKDYEAVGDIIAKAAKIRKLDEPEIQVLPAEMYPKPYRIFSLDVTAIGLPPVNRQEVARQIEMLQIPEMDKQHLRRDALIEDVDFTELLDRGKSSQN